MTLPRAQAKHRTTRAGHGFTFLEVLVVMAVLAVLLGLGIGFIANVGRSSLAQQAAAILGESGQRCLNQSAGGKRATLELANVSTADGDRVEVRTAVQRQILSANFESTSLDKAEPDWRIFANEPTVAKVTGNVTLDLAGKAGACAMFKHGGAMEYGNRTAFAMTDGVLVTCWVKPDASGRTMSVLKADAEGLQLWEVRLVQAVGRVAAFDVELRLKSVAADVEGAMPAGDDVVATTTGSPVSASRWSELQVSWDGRDSAIEVDGVPRKKSERVRGTPAPAAAGAKSEPPAVKARRLYVPSSGAVRLTTGPNYIGGLDTLTVSGIFRNDEDIRRLPYGVAVMRPPLPIRVVFANGRLDPIVHRSDVVVRITGPGDSEGGGYTVVRYGLYGSLPPPIRVEPIFEEKTPGGAADEGMK